MSVYLGKVIELVAIEKKNEKSYLRIHLSFEQEVELLWEIDSDTADNLMTLSEFDGNQKYRLSLHSTLDTTNKQYQSLITKTYLDNSERIYFDCSVEYKKGLDSIRSLQCINDLNKLPYLTMILSAIDEKKIEHKSQEKEVVTPKGNKLLLKWLSAVVMICVLSVILFGYANNRYINKTIINNTTIANVEVESAEIPLENRKNVVTPVTKLVKNDSTISSLPSLKLGDNITYGIPAGYVSLTFDDGPSKYTMQIIDILKQYKVGGTFFFVGSNVIKYPDYVRYVQLNGYSIGSHSMNHVNMTDLNYEKQEDELIKSTKAIEDITNEEVVLFRPPYGELNEQTIDVINNYQDKIILWNSDPKDWKTNQPDKVYNYVRNTKSSGSIILLHESQAVIETLPKIIEHLKEQNLHIVNLE